MIFRILALFVIALAVNSLLRKLFHSLAGPRGTLSGGRSPRAAARGARRASGRAEPADFEVIDDDTP